MKTVGAFEISLSSLAGQLSRRENQATAEQAADKRVSVHAYNLTYTARSVKAKAGQPSGEHGFQIPPDALPKPVQDVQPFPSLHREGTLCRTYELEVVSSVAVEFKDSDELSDFFLPHQPPDKPSEQPARTTANRKSNTKIIRFRIGKSLFVLTPRW